MSENARNAVAEALQDFSPIGCCGIDDDLAAKMADAAILAYEQHRSKQEPVGYEVNFRTFGEGWVGWHRPGPEFTREHYQKKAKTQPDRYLYRDLYASPQPADLGALREALEVAQLWLANCTPTVDLPGPKPLPLIAVALATSGGGE